MAFRTDFLVLGSGIAGLSLALELARIGSVLVVTKRNREESNTKYAQGGIAAVLSEVDSFDAHKRDTMVAGAGLCHEATVDLCVREGPSRIAMLVGLGARFDKANDGSDALDLHLEGGHSARRVAHTGDMTGAEIERALVEAVESDPRIQVLDDHMAVDLILQTRFGGPEACIGAYVLHSETGRVETVLASHTVLATGGAGKVYLYTSNPDVATGDGVAMAYRAGARIANMEFYQFHPTCLFHPQAKSFLVSEALRGEGATLHLANGERFMLRHDERAELAPRDVVARAIDAEMKRTGADCVFLDITHKPAEHIREHFPGIYAQCLAFGIDITKDRIPVVPAAHYMCGGVSTDLDGRTTIPRLWAIGECAHTGLHGANRLASNSLLEGVVFAHRCAQALATEPRKEPSREVPDWDASGAVSSSEQVIVTHDWDELRRTMWNYVGIVRSDHRLRRAARRIALLQEEINEYYWKYTINRDLLELRNIATVAQLVVECALARKESRGLHTTLDYPETNARAARDTIVQRGVPAHLSDRSQP
jgi:L-aspartate oxidase